MSLKHSELPMRDIKCVFDKQHSVELLVECCFTSTETEGLLGTGAQDGHLDFDTAAGL